MKRRRPVSGGAANRNSKPVEHDGYTFRTTKERNVYVHLKLREKAGDITRLEVQPRFPLIVNGKPLRLPKLPGQKRQGHPVSYIADFAYWLVDPPIRRVVEVKGVWTAEARLKVALAEAIYGITVEIL